MPEKFSGSIRVCLALCFLSFFLCLHGQDARAASSLFASCIRPAPILEPASYLFCRSDAWLKALEKADATLPTDISIQLWKHDLTGETVRLALVALLFKIGTVTPDISISPEIRVFLERQNDLSIDRLLEEPEKLLVLSAIIGEMRFIIKKMHDNWPNSQQEIEQKTEEFQNMANILTDLWEAKNIITPESENTLIKNSHLLRLFIPLSCLPGLAAIANTLEYMNAKRPQAAQLAASNASREIESRLAEEREDRQAWLFLYAWALYLRGMAHEQLNQIALAGKDFEKAAEIMAQFSSAIFLQVPLHLELANVARLRNLKPLMCKELEKACSLGSCQELARVRRMGECVPIQGSSQ